MKRRRKRTIPYFLRPAPFTLILSMVLSLLASLITGKWPPF